MTKDEWFEYIDNEVQRGTLVHEGFLVISENVIKRAKELIFFYFLQGIEGCEPNLLDISYVKNCITFKWFKSEFDVFFYVDVYENSYSYGFNSNTTDSLTTTKCLINFLIEHKKYDR